MLKQLWVKVKRWLELATHTYKPTDADYLSLSNIVTALVPTDDHVVYIYKSIPRLDVVTSELINRSLNFWAENRQTKLKEFIEMMKGTGKTAAIYFHIAYTGWRARVSRDVHVIVLHNITFIQEVQLLYRFVGANVWLWQVLPNGNIGVSKAASINIGEEPKYDYDECLINAAAVQNLFDKMNKPAN